VNTADQTPPRLVHLTTTDGSLEILLGPQLEAFANHGFEVIGVSAAGPYVEALERRGVRHIALKHATRAMAPGEDIRAFFELVRLFRRLRPAIVHTHNPKPGLYGRYAARLARVPVIVNTVHGLYALPEDRWYKRTVVYALERAAAACSDAELLQNEEDVAPLRRWRVPKERIAVLGNGIDLHAFDRANVSDADRQAARCELGAADDGDIVVGAVGRLVREKGYASLFDAAWRLREQMPNVRVAVIGASEPDKADALDEKELAAARGIGVRFLGHRHDLARFYAAMDIHVLASHREGFPRSPMEAAAMRVPVVATDVRGCRQVVDDGVTGFLVPPRQGAPLAAAIAQLAGNPALRRSMGEAGRRKAERDFDQQHCIDLTLDTYRRLLAKTARR
jgi:glycosyltransferase involved in cell wall biosynthesis